MRILGQDDWLIFARKDDGTLVYVVIETDHHWLDAPHKGDCWDEKTMRNCDGETLFCCRRDSAFMQQWVTSHQDDYDWLECGNDPVSGEYLGWDESRDAEFTRSSEERYLPK